MTDTVVTTVGDLLAAVAPAFREVLTAEEHAATTIEVRSDLQDFVAESSFAWGQLRL